MTDPSNRPCDVLIIGAGPTGLVLALALRRLGASVRIIDREAEPGTTSRALVVQARTLEWYHQLGVADDVLARGHAVTAINLWVSGRRRARIGLEDLGNGLSPFPHPLIFPQDEHERLLIGHLAALGVRVDRQLTFIDASDSGERIIARLRRQDGTFAVQEAAYLAGCDGGRSATRESLQIGFPGGTYDHLFYVADVVLGDGTREDPPSAGQAADAAPGAGRDGGLHLGLDAVDFLAVFPLAGGGRARLIGTAMRDRSQPLPELAFCDVEHRVIGWMRLDVRQVNWFSTYRVHHRVAERFRRGRAFLLGDAAHVHSPVGGQGMNTGIGDAVNLAWKLAAVLQGRMPGELLDTYEPERIAFARRLVATTDRGFVAITSSSSWARAFRLRLMPILAPLVFAIRTMRRVLFRTVSQISISYRGCSDLSRGRAGAVRGGDRLPWVRLADGGSNFDPLRSLAWQIHVYGDAAEGVTALCRRLALPLHAFAWSPRMGRSGLRRCAAYLVRPDGHIGAVDAGGGCPTIAAYALRWRIGGRASLR